MANEDREVDKKHKPQEEDESKDDFVSDEDYDVYEIMETNPPRNFQYDSDM